MIARLQLSLSEKHREDRLAANVVSKNTSTNLQETNNSFRLVYPHFHLPNEVIHEQYATSASQVKPIEAVLKLTYTDRSSSTIANRNITIDGANEAGSQLNDVGELKWRLPSCSLLYLSNMEQVSKQLSTFGGRKSNKFYQGSLIQVNLSLVYCESVCLVLSTVSV